MIRWMPEQPAPRGRERRRPLAGTRPIFGNKLPEEGGSGKVVGANLEDIQTGISGAA